MENKINIFYLRVCLVYLLFLTYACIVPLQLHITFEEFIAHIHKIRWLPFIVNGHRESLTDIASNLTLFFPFGFLFAGAFYRKLGSFRLLLLALCTGATVSCVQEILQLFTENRVTSVTDIISNSIGTTAGASISVLYHKKFHGSVKQFFHNLIKKPVPVTCTFLVVGSVIFLQLSPFDVTIDVSGVKEAVKYFLRTMSLLPDSTQLLSSINNFILFALVQFFLQTTLKDTLHRNGYGLFAFISTIFLAFSIEFIQLFIQSHTATLPAFFFAVLGAGW